MPPYKLPTLGAVGLGTGLRLACAVLLVTSAAALADNASAETAADGVPSADAVPSRPEETTTVTVGAGVGYAPEFLGADDNEVGVVPLVRVTNLYGFNLAPFNASYDLVRHRSEAGRWGVRAGPYLSLDFGRDEDDSDALDGLGDVGFGVLAGAFVDLRYGPALFNVTAAQDLAGGHGGFVVNTGVNLRLNVTEALSVMPGLSATWASEDYTQSFFGITDAQAADSIYEPFDADAGFRDVGLNVSVQYEVVEDWVVTGLVSYSRLVGDAAESPIVQGPGGSPDQVRVVFGVTRRFAL